MLRHFLFLLCALVGAGSLHAQSLWHEASASAAPIAGERRIVPEKFRPMHLDLEAMQSVLSQAPEAFSASAMAQNPPVIEVPTPDGKMNRFQMVETPVMAPELQAKYPEIRCYTGRGIDDPTAKVKLDVTPWGFHSMVTSAYQGTIYIDPMVHGNTDYYVVYFKKDFVKAKTDTPWTCSAETPDGAVEFTPQPAHEQTATPDFQGDTKLRRYRLALSCTGEYATFHGGTKPLVLAAMNTSMNRVNGVYETDFAVTMQIIANNDLLIYLNAGSDPFTNDDGGAMLGQNQTTVTNIIGAANYDIGHVFSTGGGGVAYLGVVCGSNLKAGGVTGSGAPVGDPFDIDYVAHEMGHQFAGNHTFNHCGSNNNDPAAVEPGSGTTIMAYAGICGGDDVAAHSEDIFHGYNISEMGAFIYSGGGNTCPVKINSTNNNPTVDAGPNYIIPKSTPFALTAVGSDINGDTLTYTWEQMDVGNAASPPTATTAVGPLFRSYKGTTSPTRVFPRLQDLVNNVNPTWEELPGVARTMNFRVTVRDNDWFAGCTDEDDMAITVSAASGPFVVTAPNTNILWNVETTQTVTWNVANTTAAPVSCANVRILLSTDGGFTYPIVLAASEPNDGSATITVPNNVSNTCRVKVESLGNIFFDISNANFRIEPPLVPTYFLTTSTGATTVCAGASASFNVNLSSVLGFNTPATISITGAPAGATVNIAPNPLTPAGSAAVTVSNLTPAMAGNYSLLVQTVAGAIIRTATVNLTVLPGAPGVATTTSPVNGANGLATTTVLSWNAPYADGAVVEIATNPSFSAAALVQTLTATGTTATVSGLNLLGVYYWRVRSTNSCGEAAFSAFSSFQVGTPSCDIVVGSTEVPRIIDANSVNVIVSNLLVPTSNTILDANISLDITHSYVSDLSAVLISPTNDTIVLFDQPGIPGTSLGCGGNNASLVFDSESSQDASILENQCNSVPPALVGSFQSIEPLTVLNGKNAQGNWRLFVVDSYNEDGGALTEWHISFCFPGSVPAGFLLSNNPLDVPNGGTNAVATSNLEQLLTGSPVQGQYILLSLPTHGVLSFAGIPLDIGSVFTQQDINAGLVTYTHSGDAATADSFHFDALDTNNSHWVFDAVFNINIVVNNLAVTAAETNAVLCHEDNTGEITATATGLNGAYTYSLNGGDPQASNVFVGLTAGTYTVVVTGQFGFTAVANVVTLADAPAITVSATANVDDVTVTTSGGTGVFEYSINGVDFQAENTFIDLANGVYTVTVRDENGCTATTEVIVAVNSLLASAVIQQSIRCAGGSDGVISVTVGGGQSPYTYTLSNGTEQSSGVFTGLSADTYTVTVTDNVGFSVVSSSVVLANPPAIVATASATLNVITVTATGGTGALEYSIGGAFQSSNVFPGQTNGTYTVTVRDANDCIVETVVVVNVDPLALTAAFTGALDCFGAADGTITALATGGIPPYSYKLNNDTYQSGNEFTGLTAGTYLVWVRDAVGTEVSFAVTIAQPTQVVASVVVTGNDATASFAGGTPPYTYSTNAPNSDLQNLPNGTYDLVVTDAHGCTAIASFTVDVAPLVVSGTFNGVSCNGGSNGSITVSATGGIPPYEYSLNNGTFQSGNTFTGLTAGNYTVTVRDADGTLQSSNFTLSQPPVLDLTANANGNSITAQVNGGTAPYSYQLNNGQPQTSGTFNNLAPGNYTVVVTDAGGCTASVTGVMIVSAVVEPAEAWGLTVSPNPGSGMFQLTMQSAPNQLHTDVYDANGRLLRSLTFTPHGGQFSTSLDLRDLPNGAYLLRLSDGQQWGSVRLSKVE